MPSIARSPWLIGGGQFHRAALLSIYLFALSAGGDPLDQWTLRNPLPPGTPLSAVAYGDGLFVAVGDAGAIWKSADAKTWTRSTVTSEKLSGIAYGNSLFVAVAESGVILQTSDLVNWKQCLPEQNARLQAVAFGNGRFVGVGWVEFGYSAAVLVSADGVSWTNSPVDLHGGKLYGIAFGNDQFLAVGEPGIVTTSPDGVTWDNQRAGGGTFEGVAYGGGTFVAAGWEEVGPYAPERYAITLKTDGRSFSKSTLGYGILLQGVAYGDGLFVAVGGAPGSWNALLVSSDGLSWTNRDPATSLQLRGVAYGGGDFVAVGGESLQATIVSSADGLHWSNRNSVAEQWLSSVAYGTNRFVAVGGVTLASDDGITWTNLGTANSPFGVTWGGDQFVTVGYRGAIASSGDGLKWSIRPSPTTNEINAVAWGCGKFVGVGWGVILTSADAAAWNLVTLATNWILSAVCFGGETFVAVGMTNTGTAGVLLTSTDGQNWTSMGNISKQLYGVAYGNGRFVAAGLGGLLLSSSDAVHWTAAYAATNSSFSAIAYGAGRFVSVGGSTIASSTDGIHWSLHEPGLTQGGFCGVGFGNETFVAVGWHGTILQSARVSSATLSPPRFLSDRAALLTVSGLPGRSYAIEASLNLGEWATITNLTLANPSADFLDRSASNYANRFYRARSE